MLFIVQFLILESLVYDSNTYVKNSVLGRVRRAWTPPGRASSYPRLPVTPSRLSPRRITGYRVAVALRPETGYERDGPTAATVSTPSQQQPQRYGWVTRQC